MLGLGSWSKTASAPCHRQSQSSPFVQQEPDIPEPDTPEHGHEDSIDSVSQSLEIAAPPFAAILPRPSGHQRSISSISATQDPDLPTTHTRNEQNPQLKGLSLPPSLFTKSTSITSDLSPPSSPLSSTAKDKWSFIPAFKSTKSSEERSEAKASKFANWFQGESAPVVISVLPSPSREKADPMEYMRETARNSPRETPRGTPAQSPHRRPQLATRQNYASSGPSLLSYFTNNKNSPLQQSCSEQSGTDLLLTLDVKKALYPNGSIDTFSPAALKNLQQTAEGLLLDLQTAYRARVFSLEESITERDTQADELEEGKTRTKHLKSQLNEMSSRIAEQDKAMMNLVEELAHEKQLRKEEADARERERSVRMVYDPEERDNSPHRGRMRRVSLGSTTSSAPSMISDCDSPISAEGTRTIDSYRPMISATPETPRSLSPVAIPFQYKQHTNSFPQPPVHILPTPAKSECKNCCGVKPGSAVRVVGDLRSENTVLRRRVGHLERELDGCLELVRGMGA